MLPASEIDGITDNIGIPNSWNSLAQGDVPNISSADGEILIALNREKHGPVREYEVLLRKRLTERFPEMVFFFEPADITNQILNFGLPAPIDLQIAGRDVAGDYKIAQRLRDRMAAIPGAADVHIHEVYREPQLTVNVDRVKAGEMGLTQSDVASSLLISLSGNNQVSPNFWMNPVNGVTYNVGVQTSQYRVDSMDSLLDTPITAKNTQVASDNPTSLNGDASALAGNPAHLLTNIASVKRGYGPVIVNHWNVVPVFDIYANVDRRDLGSVGAAVAEDHAR